MEEIIIEGVALAVEALGTVIDFPKSKEKKD